MTGRIILAQPDDLVLRPNDLEVLRQLDRDGAWSEAELQERMQGSVALHRAGLIARTSTVIGSLTYLTPQGAAILGIRTGELPKLNRRLDRAYVRLSLTALGWQVMPERQQLEEFDTSGRMTAVMTPFTADYGSGAALVAGKLPAGYSSSGIQHIVDRLRSQALHHNFWVIFLTPRPRRGQGFAERYPSWLKVIHVLPGQPEPGIMQGILQPASRVNPIIVEGGVEQFRKDAAARGIGYTDAALRTLSLRLADRLEVFREALEVDRVISNRQAWMYYGLSPNDLSDMISIDLTAQPVHSAPGLLVQTRLYLADKHLQYKSATGLGHAAGVTQMRLLLGLPADPETWITGKRLGRQEYEQPDAVHVGEFGLEALEYDTGAYTTRIIENKLTAFRDQGYDTVIWGVPGIRRQQRLQAELGHKVLHARWC